MALQTFQNIFSKNWAPVLKGLKSMKNNGSIKTGLQSRSRSSIESEFFGWSQIPNNTGSRSRIFLSDSRCPIGSFFKSHS